MNVLKTTRTTCVLALLLLVWSCQTAEKSNPNYQKEAANPEFLHQSLVSLTKVIKHDLFAPMIAARIYTYAQIAAYEALNAQTPQYQSLAGQIKDLPEMPKAEAGKDVCLPLAAVKAYFKVGKQLTFSGDSMDVEWGKMMTEFKKVGIPKEVFDRSIALGDTIGGTILKWSAGDNYAPTRSMPKYTIKQQNPATWRPTMPDYADALEPNWNKIRPLLMDSAAQFKPTRPTTYDSSKTSKFYKEAFEVYKTVADSTPERIATAWYWDDNPIATLNAGHFNIIRKKVTPTGHWMWITMYACRQQSKDIFETSEAYVKVAIGLFDAFISCWDEKYRSEVVRPETYIGQFIAPQWTPIIVTPPFPEYTSGHSCVSGASSTILTDVFKTNTAFTDSTEVQFGIPPRSFKSFDEAAQQAAISRMYAGIHYRPACDNGITQGQAVGKQVLAKVKTKK
ncbi:MAG: vanadium-dependent haloperoxidase [Saprospiraceae bacterium]|nr:vanadium-dependent haloperoxidase [Saprospiraceae bacterium]